MHTSIFQTPLLLGLLYNSAIYAFPFPRIPQNPIVISHFQQPQSQHLMTPSPPKDKHIRGRIHMQSTLYPDVPLTFTITPTKNPTLSPGALSALVEMLSTELLYQRPYGIDLLPDSPVALSSSPMRRGGLEDELTVAFMLLPDEDEEREEKGKERARIGKSELGFLLRLFEEAIGDLDDALREEERGIGSVVLKGEADGVGMRCEFVISREKDEGC
ncbi:hypothetical protein N431DRAFT_464224 [Stipitochalara longipes BDJ]|nr:hypothetical protein N431DRAFT_464224 [Stipitochalara longipes BDJ]